MSPALAPFNPPLGPQPANAHLYSNAPQTLQMREKVFSLSGDDFTVKTVEGLEVCRCKGKVLSVHAKKKFTLADSTDAELFTLNNKMFALQKSFHGESPSGHDFEVKGHFQVIGSHSTVTFKNAADASHCELEVKGDWMDRSAEIAFGGRPVAKISRSFFNVREIFGDKQTVRDRYSLRSSADPAEPRPPTALRLIQTSLVLRHCRSQRRHDVGRTTTAPAPSGEPATCAQPVADDVHRSAHGAVRGCFARVRRRAASPSSGVVIKPVAVGTPCRAFTPGLLRFFAPRKGVLWLAAASRDDHAKAHSRDMAKPDRTRAETAFCPR
nr:hypothetical protein CFP56_04304 [Quercus suber]